MASGDKHQRTEKPTPKRKNDARKRGQVARSPDIAGWSAVLFSSFLLPWLVESATTRVVAVTGAAMNVIAKPTTAAAFAVLTKGLQAAFYTVLPFSAALAVLGIATNLIQVGKAASFQAAKPKFSRINPKEGLRRLASPATLIQLARQVAKLLLLSGLAYGTLRSIIHFSTTRQPVGLQPIVAAAVNSIMTYVKEVAALGVAIGVADLVYQRHHLMKSLKMTRQEVKDESKAAEGDPTVKGELRKRQYAIARSRMLAALRTADLLVTNPTHFAVALRYEQGAGGAPVVVARGADEFALRLREEAAEYGVPLVEDPPLARWMFSFCEVDRPVPADIYIAVAKVLAFVYSLPPSLRHSTLRPAHSEVPVDPGAETGVAFGRRYRRTEADRVLATEVA